MRRCGAYNFLSTMPKLIPPNCRSTSHLARAALVGILAGVTASGFLYLLDFATRTREAAPFLVGALPFLGLGVGALYHHFGGPAQKGARLLLEEIHEPKQVIPARLAPLVLVGTLATHLGGGSAGREGTAVQMGGSLAEMVAQKFRVSAEERRQLLMAGLGAGFGAAVGAPLAGVIFGLEVIYAGRLRIKGILAVAIASVLAAATAHLLRAPHTVYPSAGAIPFDGLNVVKVILAGLAFGLGARIFIAVTHLIESAQTRFVRYPPLRPFVGGCLLLALFSLLGSLRYAGLGIPVIQAALTGEAMPLDPLAKGIATALTLGSGFKGGEFIPLVFIGATLGTLLAGLLSVPANLLASVGFSALFGAAARAPLACAVMSAELFGISVFPYALAAGYAAFLLSGSRSVYPGQRHPLK